MEIVNLADRPEFLLTVVEWLFNEWGVKGDENNYVFWDSWVRSSMSKVDVPQTHIAIEDNKVVATFSLWRCDLQSRQDLFPWFGGLYVEEKKRKSGYGIIMQKQAMQILKELGYTEVFLFTDIEGYYEKTGWIFMELIPDETGKMVRLYKNNIIL